MSTLLDPADLRPFDPEDIHIPVGEPDPDLYEMPSYAFAHKPLSHAELTAAIERDRKAYGLMLLMRQAGGL